MNNISKRLKEKGYKVKKLKPTKDKKWLKLAKKAHENALKMCKAVEDAYKKASKSKIIFK
jgi:hypothetical protein